jgi:hypothetical protein
MHPTTVAKARAQRRASGGLKQASSLLGGALLGTSFVLPILAGGDVADGDALVIFLSGLMAVLGIGMHVTGSAGSLHAAARTLSVPTIAEEHSRPLHPMRERSADARSIV